MQSLPRLLRYFRPYKGRMAAAILMLTIAGALASVVVAALKPLVNEVILGRAEVQIETPVEPPVGGLLGTITQKLEDLREGFFSGAFADFLRQHAFVAIPLLIVVVAFVRGVFLYFGNYLTTQVGVLVIRNLRAELYESIVFQSLRFFRFHSTGTLMSQVFSDVQRLRRVTTELFAELIRISAMLPFLLLVSVIHSWQITALALVGVPLLTYPMVRLSVRLRRASRRSQENMAEATSLLTETVIGIKVVQAFAMERLGMRRFRAALDRMLRADLRAGRTAAASGPLLELVGAVMGAALFMLAGEGIASGRIDPGDFVVAMGGLGLIHISVRRLNRINVQLQEALAAADRVFVILDTPREIRDAPGAAPLPPFAREVRFEGVEFAYEAEPVLHGVDLVIARGEMVALVGPSGSGKTTIANLLLRFHDPTAGRITVDGRDIREASLASLRGLIGLVTQETILFDGSVIFNIACGREDVSGGAVIEAARAAHAHEFIERMPLGYETPLGELGARLSTGQRQRIAIARALLKDPSILVLDEATSALDSESERLVQEALETLLAGRTSLVIAHRLSTVRRADRIVVLDAGRIVEEGTHGELLARDGLYTRLHELQFQDA